MLRPNASVRQGLSAAAAGEAEKDLPTQDGISSKNINIQLGHYFVPTRSRLACIIKTFK